MPKIKDYIPKDFFEKYEPHKNFYKMYHGCRLVN